MNRCSLQYLSYPPGPHSWGNTRLRSIIFRGYKHSLTHRATCCAKQGDHEKMGGECYHYVNLKSSAVLTESAKAIYADTVVPQLLQAVARFREENQASNERLQVTADLSSGIRIAQRSSGSRVCSGDIVCPPSLDQTLSVGWQHRQYASVSDPKFSIAETLMEILMSSPPALRGLLQDKAEDNAWADLRDDDGDEYGVHDRQEELDYTACSAHDCGYCGKCFY